MTPWIYMKSHGFIHYHMLAKEHAAHMHEHIHTYNNNMDGLA